MKAIKQHDTYTALHHCLEAHFGDRHAARISNVGKYREPEQGFRTVPFQSGYPLQLDYMRRRKNDSFIRTAFGFINLKRNNAK